MPWLPALIAHAQSGPFLADFTGVFCETAALANVEPIAEFPTIANGHTSYLAI